MARDDRRQPGDRAADQRDEFQRDRDRVLYSSAFRRLAGVTQVAHAGEGQVFHNRLTHTLEVAQIARRLAEYRIKEQPDLAAMLGVNAEVAEAAALAHDLGHPPFGHHAEVALDRRLREHEGVQEGFEGNAQSFRIIALLSVRAPKIRGLNLTRATLNAISKYPWHRRAEKGDKFGAYVSEGEDFRFARAEHIGGPTDKSAEAEIMDWADDIAYAIHDLEDFYRAGLIPLDRILEQGTELDTFLDHQLSRWTPPAHYPDKEKMRQIFKELLAGLPAPPEILRPYGSTIAQRAALRSFTGQLVRRYVIGAEGLPPFELADPDDSSGRCVTLNPTAEVELGVLKRLTWEYVIENPRLVTQQAGQEKVVRELFDAYRDSAAKDGTLLPPSMRELLGELLPEAGADQRDAVCCRVAVDCLCRLTDDEAIKLFRRITGHAPGSILDGLIR